MIPSEVIEIADLMVPDGWRDTVIEDDVLKAAWRTYNAGYRKQAESDNERLRAALSDLLRYLDDHNWGLIPEGATADRARDAIGTGYEQKAVGK